MKVVQIHNFYNIRGGEDAVVDSEKKMLAGYGTYLQEYYVNNIDTKSFFTQVVTALFAHYSLASMFRLKRFLSAGVVCHVHNFFPRLTPSIFDSIIRSKAASVLTLHNYRSICPTSLLMYNGKPCERSLSESAYWALPYKVYRDSYIGTAVLAHLIEYHKRKKTWENKVDRFICLTEFSRSKFIQAGFPEHKLVVKPNFCEDPGYESNVQRDSNCVFVGRLSNEKGIHILMDSWESINFPIRVIGEGKIDVPLPMAVNLEGRKMKRQVFEAIKKAQFIIVPSICYEGFPMVIVEAFACGTPVVCSRLGSMEEIVEDGITGLHFEAGNSEDLAQKVQWMIQNPDMSRKMGDNARQEYLDKYTPEINYKILMNIYHEAIEEAKKR